MMLTGTERYVLDCWRRLYGRWWKTELIRLWRGEPREQDAYWEGSCTLRPVPVDILFELRAKFGPGLSRLKEYGLEDEV